VGVPRDAPLYIGVAGEDNPSIDATIAYPSPAGIDGQDAARMILAQMLNIRMQVVREELGASYGTYARHANHRGPGAYQMGGALDADRAPEALKAMREGVDRLRRGEKFDEDFVKARRVALTQLVSIAGESAATAGQLSTIARYNLPNDYYEKLIKRVAALSPAQVKALIETELDPNKEIVVLLGGKAKVQKAFEGAGIKTVKMVEAEGKVAGK